MTGGLTIRSRDGLQLEAALDAPDDPRAVLVVCHPHPQMGGTMNAPLLIAVRDEMVRRGWGVLRFNFRGIGASEGESGDGLPEIEDARGAVDHLFEAFPACDLAIAGWSFGAAVAVRLAEEEPRLRACVAIAPPVDAKPGITAGLPAAGKVDLLAPVLLVYGENDKQIPPEACHAWGVDAGVEVQPVPGANHFFWAKYEQLSAIVGEWLDDRVRGTL